MKALAIHYRTFVLLAWFAALVACSEMMPKVEGPRDAVAVSYASIEAGADVTGRLLSADTISASEARIAQKILERSFALTKIAEREVLAGKPESAEAILATVSRLLADVQEFLGQEW